MRRDRFRAPLKVIKMGDRRHAGAWDELDRRFHSRTPCQEHRVFLVGCGGAVGVTVSTRWGEGRTSVRPLAP